MLSEQLTEMAKKAKELEELRHEQERRIAGLEEELSQQEDHVQMYDELVAYVGDVRSGIRDMDELYAHAGVQR